MLIGDFRQGIEATARPSRENYSFHVENLWQALQESNPR